MLPREHPSWASDKHGRPLNCRVLACPGSTRIYMRCGRRFVRTPGERDDTSPVWLRSLRGDVIFTMQNSFAPEWSSFMPKYVFFVCIRCVWLLLGECWPEAISGGGLRQRVSFDGKHRDDGNIFYLKKNHQFGHVFLFKIRHIKCVHVAVMKKCKM